MKPVKWGVLGTSNVAVKKVIPGMQKSPLCQIHAIASRDESKALACSRQLNIPHAYGSYEALLADPLVDCVYIPLPNHLHVPWAIKAAQAGKHVLCEKPIALNAAEVRQLIEARDRHNVHIEEAFMVRYHPQWQRARVLTQQGAIGNVRSMQVSFSFYNDNPNDYRNQTGTGGGGLYDIGCYPVVVARMIFGTEPLRAFSAIDIDPQFHVDRLASGILEFPQGQVGFMCSTQLTSYQRAHIFGTHGRIEIEIPFNAPPDSPCRIFIDTDGALADASRRSETFEISDQYCLQGEAFAHVVRNAQPSSYPLEDALHNMRVIDALFLSGKTGTWQNV